MIETAKTVTAPEMTVGDRHAVDGEAGKSLDRARPREHRSLVDIGVHRPHHRRLYIVDRIEQAVVVKSPVMDDLLRASAIEMDH